MLKRNLLDRIMEVAVIILLAIMCILVIWQVFSRFILNNPSSWSEEISKYLSIWMSFLAGALGVKYGTHMGLDVLVNRIKMPHIRAAINILAALVCLMFGGILTVYGYIFMMTGWARMMICAPIPMAYVYVVIPVSGVVLMFNSVGLIVKAWQNRDILPAEEEEA